MILVTGATGHLGQWTVAALLSGGHDVLCASRKPIMAPTIAGVGWAGPVRAVRCDLATGDLDALRSHLSSLRAVVHLGAYIPSETARNDDADARTTLQTNAAGTARLLGLLGGAPHLKSVVYASTFEVYGPNVPLPATENHPTEPLNYYGASKLAGEKYVRLFGVDRSVPCAALRLPAIYGPGDTIRRAIGNFVRAAVEGGTIQIQGDGADLRELVYVADAARAVALCIENRTDGVFNVASGCGISIREMAETVRRAAGGHVPIVVSDRIKARVDYVLDITRARETFGWSPTTSLDDGVRAQLEWVRTLH